MKKFKIPRVFIIQAACVFMFSVLVYYMFKLQIINGQDYAGEASQSFTRAVYERSARGNIYDCNGKVLAYNEMVYTVTMADTGKYSSAREKNLCLNSTIYHVIKRLNFNNENINNEIKIKVNKNGIYKYTVAGSLLDRFKADVFGEADPGNLTEEQKNITAGDMVKFLSGDSKFALYGWDGEKYLDSELEEYGLPDKFTKEEILTITGIRYMLFLNTYRRYLPVVIAKDVSEKTVVYIKENMAELTGVDTGYEWKRVYSGGEAFSHILGYTGKISAEELESYTGKNKAYKAGLVIGKTGIEQYMEDELQGIDGEKEIQVDNLGRKTGEGKTVRRNKPGKDVYLSIDKDLQIAVYDILEQKLAGIISSNLINARKFDKTNISDASDIRITICDVYIALVENNVIQIQDLYNPGAGKFERHIAGILDRKCKRVVKDIRRDLSEGRKDIKDLSGELQDYEYFIVNKSGILDENLIEKEDGIYLKWKCGGKTSTREFLRYAIQQRWINKGVIRDSRQYITTNELYGIIIDGIADKLENNREFSKILFKYLILEDGITGIDIIKLLCRQGVLSMDSDYNSLMAGRVSAFSYIKKKIEKLQITPAQLALDPCSASAVIVYKDSGKVAACVSYPGYNNNHLANQMDTGYYNRLLNDRSLPLYNRATMQLTAPGSIFKPVTIIAGIQEGVISPDTSIICDGVFDKLQPSLRCWNHSGHGNVPDAATAIQFSCNDYLCEISYRMGTLNGREYNDKKALAKLQEYAKLFHMDKKTGVEIAEAEPHITGQYGIPSAIGQGTHNYSTIQIARYINSIASGGKIYSLSLVKGVGSANGKIASKKAVVEGKAEFTPYVWNVVHSGMEQFAENNTILKDLKLKIAGKTGTAQEAADRPDHSLFAGYAPSDKPEISIAVRIANGYGSSNATAIGRDIFRYYFKLDRKKSIVTGKASQAVNTSTD